eukprot:gene10731-287_t
MSESAMIQLRDMALDDPPWVCRNGPLLRVHLVDGHSGISVLKRSTGCKAYRTDCTPLDYAARNFEVSIFCTPGLNFANDFPKGTDWVWPDALNLPVAVNDVLDPRVPWTSALLLVEVIMDATMDPIAWGYLPLMEPDGCTALGPIQVLQLFAPPLGWAPFSAVSACWAPIASILCGALAPAPARSALYLESSGCNSSSATPPTIFSWFTSPTPPTRLSTSLRIRLRSFCDGLSAGSLQLPQQDMHSIKLRDSSASQLKATGSADWVSKQVMQGKGPVLQVSGGQRGCLDVVFSPNGQYLAVGLVTRFAARGHQRQSASDGLLSLDLKEQLGSSFDSGVTDMCLCERRHSLLVQTLRDTSIWLLDTVTLAVLKQFRGASWGGGLRARFAEKMSGHMMVAPSDAGHLVFWNLNNGQILGQQKINMSSLATAVAWSPSADIIAVGSFGTIWNTVSVWYVAPSSGPAHVYERPASAMSSDPVSQSELRPETPHRQGLGARPHTPRTATLGPARRLSFGDLPSCPTQSLSPSGIRDFKATQ